MLLLQERILIWDSTLASPNRDPGVAHTLKWWLELCFLIQASIYLKHSLSNSASRSGSPSQDWFQNYDMTFFELWMNQVLTGATIGDSGPTFCLSMMTFFVHWVTALALSMARCFFTRSRWNFRQMAIVVANKRMKTIPTTTANAWGSKLTSIENGRVVCEFFGVKSSNLNFFVGACYCRSHCWLCSFQMDNMFDVKVAGLNYAGIQALNRYANFEWMDEVFHEKTFLSELDQRLFWWETYYWWISMWPFRKRSEKFFFLLTPFRCKLWKKRILFIVL